MNKFAQYDQYEPAPRDGFSTLAKYMAMPLGLGAGLYGLKTLWSGSPGLQAAAMLGGPYALYKYMQYGNEANIADALAGAHKDFVGALKKNPNAAYIPQEQIARSQYGIEQNVMDKYRNPAYSALVQAAPLFAVGAALPTALRAISGHL